VPIYVPLDSADVWANPELFQLDPSRRPTAVAGCPPDGFSADGQLWGNPIYDWEKMHAERYHWWIRRMKAAARMYDVVRFDHFRGFESYWSVPAGSKTAATGSWRKGPGMDFVGAIRKALPDLPIIAEDLGYVTQEVKDLLRSSGYPGMKVMEFAFDTREPSAKDYLPHCYTENSVVYTGTHDNLTLKQWFDEAAAEDIENAVRYLGLNDREGYVWGMIRGAMGSVSKLCIVQMQDYLEVGREGRMNHPGTLTNANWTWRARPGFASDALAQKIRTTTELYGRM
jgi:4-alpha-glucanotransferase